ncbi:MAG: GNAT family N-acetyltransferase [Kiritimatiellae bacterium]|nr:GNAT family N-acetyltransferase [Kiritimatiellia bacterium]MDD5523324.1 GNAT family N-acetyltransferase [Kiritimatiellia bacterium]
MKKKTYITRSAEFRDAEKIFSLIKTFPAELLPRSISDIAQNIDRFIVCEMKNKVVGTISWQILPEIGMPRHPSIEIQSLAIEKKHHKSGIGRALVNEAIKRIKPLHPHQIIALTFSPDFFRKMGFREVPKQQLMHKIYMGCINCSKYNSPFTCPEIAMTLTIL